MDDPEAITLSLRSRTFWFYQEVGRHLGLPAWATIERLLEALSEHPMAAAVVMRTQQVRRQHLTN